MLDVFSHKVRFIQNGRNTLGQGTRKALLFPSVPPSHGHALIDSQNILFEKLAPRVLSPLLFFLGAELRRCHSRSVEWKKQSKGKDKHKHLVCGKRHLEDVQHLNGRSQDVHSANSRLRGSLWDDKKEAGQGSQPTHLGTTTSRARI